MNQDELQQQVRQLERLLDRERNGRKKVEEILRNKTMELFEANKYLTSMAKRLQLALWAGNEVVWEYVIDEDSFYLYKNMNEVSANIAKMGSFDDALNAYHKDDQASASEHWHGHFSGKKADINFVARRYSDEHGGFRWNLIKAKRIFDERNGNATKIIGIFKDIHEEYIQEISYKVVRSAFTRSRTPGFIIDFSNKHIEVNDSFYLFVGMAKDNMTQTLLFNALPVKEIQAKQEKATLQFNAQISLIDEKKIDCQFSLQPMLEEKMTNSNYRFAVGTFKSPRL